MNVISIIGLAAAGLLFVLLTTVNPQDAGAIGILAVFLLTYIVIVTLTTITLFAASRLVAKLLGSLAPAAQRLSLKKAYYYASVIAVAPVVVLSLRSVGSVSAYEIALVSFFVLLGCVYVAKRAR